MTGYALWSAKSYPSGQGTLSSDSHSIYALYGAPGSRISLWSGGVYSGGKYRFELIINQVTGAGAFCGVTDSTHGLSATGGNPPYFFGPGFNGSSGNLYQIDQYGGVTTIVGWPNPVVGDRYQFCLDFTGTVKKAWCQALLGGSTYQWNGSGTANPDTGVGYIDVSYITDWLAFIQCFYGLSSPGILLNAGQQAYGAGMATSFSDLLPTLSLNSVTSTRALQAVMNWTDNNCSALEYFLDAGAAEVPTLGPTTGSGGATSTNETMSSTTTHSLALLDAGLGLDQTQPLSYWAEPPQPGGTVTSLLGTIGEISGGIGGPPPRPEIYGHFAASNSITFDIYIAQFCDPGIFVGGYFVNGSSLFVIGTELTAIPATANPVFEYQVQGAGTPTLTTLTCGSTCGNSLFGTFNGGPTAWYDTGPWNTNGQIIEDHITGTFTVTSIVAGNAYGNIEINNNAGSAIWTNTRISNSGTETSINCLQSWELHMQEGSEFFSINIWTTGGGGSGSARLLPVQIGM